MVKTIEVEAGINPNALVKEVTRISPLDALAELIDNAFDAGTLHCNIATDEANKPIRVTITDTGSGMTHDALKAFFRYGQSHWTSKRHKGTNGKGSKYILGHSKKVRFRTKITDDKMVKTFEITLESWVDFVTSQKRFKIRTDSPVGEHPLDPTGTSFTMIEFEPNDESREAFNENNLIERMAELLSPQFGDRVFVNSKQLQPRETLSVFEDQQQDPVLGEVRVFIYRPKSVKTREGHPIDELRIGTIGPVLDFRNFFRSLPRKLQIQVPSIFFNDDVCGLIEVEAFNPYREGASKEFRNGLYNSDKARRFVKYLGLLGKKLADEFGISVTNMKDKEMKNLSILEAQSQEVYGSCDDFDQKSKLSRKVSKPVFHVSPRSIEITPGEPVVLTAHGDKDDEFTWDVSDVPGATLSKMIGNEVTLIVTPDAKFTVSDQYKVVIRSKKTNTTRSIYVKISTVKDFALTPRESQKNVGEVLKLTPINIPVTTRTLDWEVQTPGIGELTKRRGKEPAYVILKSPGKCVVVAKDPHNHSISASATSYVKLEPTEEETENETPRLRIEDTLIYIATFSGGDPTQQCFVEDISTEIKRVHINSAHPRYEMTLKLSSSAWREYILNMVIRTYVNTLYHDTETDLDKKIGEILAKFATLNQ
ncbi:hypothetical protein COT97_01330 [Candidatus Falkowbacteria bacterium CG10_big_fil_rev_8_21_14_0_10_39_11]|uniref:ATP-binding protein n=1 Tax=Candidatus Falkowbacteria bacterium CG10_big_fil_rev_8_21_14_0_10_39_11 TaxID=1974565 RepID=A0A2H0V5Y1_9BACT|nr:MAG: hypothetical protein COT97_01330 [Candidatus Falkowbacteria bacterium CG10_big_fil_rev_8_21_14_0_10_39_11]